jgi:cytoskeletal protein CcmA (bactofilin family)
MFDRNKNKQVESKGSEPAPAAPRARAAAVQGSSARNGAVIGPGIVIKGEITGEEDLVIQGRVEGTIDLGERELTIGEHGRIFAEIRSARVRIEGEVTGNVTGDDIVSVSSRGNVRGNIVAPRVMLEDGAKFKGTIDMDPGAVAAGPVAVSQQKPASVSIAEGKHPGRDIKSGKV